MNKNEFPSHLFAPMKIVFLDFDGVLNYRKFLHKKKQDGELPCTEAELKFCESVPPEHDAGYYLFWLRALDPARVAIVEDLVQKSGAKVVVSSSWRAAWNAEELTNFLRAVGFTSEVIDVTPRHLHLKEKYSGKQIMRGWEIQEWLDAHPEVESFVILDDDSDMDHLSSRHIKTNYDVGITRSKAKRALKLLNTPLTPP